MSDDGDSAFGGDGTEGDDRGGRGEFGNLGKSGFAAGGFAAAESIRRVGSRRKLYTVQGGRSTRQRSTTEFGGGGGGALGVLQERSWDTAAENSCVLSATGEVVDTGIGVMPALDLARQKCGLPTSAEAATAAAEAAAGAAGVAGAAPGLSSHVGTPTGGGAMVAGEAGKPARPLPGHEDLYDEEEEELDTVQYMLGRNELEVSLGKEEVCRNGDGKGLV